MLYQRPESRRGGQNENAQPHGQQDLPSHLHELVKAISRERATIPDIEIHECSNLRRKPENILYANSHCRNEHYQANQTKRNAESGQTDGLNPKERMLRHADRVEETHRGEKKKRDA